MSGKSRNFSFVFAILVALIAAIGLFGNGQYPARASDEQQAHTGPALIELFTSQGCPACPPADLLAHVLDGEGNVIVISRPVTYWDRRGWKDTLAREENTELQQAYAIRGLGGYNGIYTPQMVVDGRFGVVGSMEADVRNSVKQRSIQSAAIRTRRLANGDVLVGLGGKTQQEAELMLVAISQAERVGIGSGSNGGRNLTYTNVLRDEAVVARWSGGKMAITINKEKMQADGANRFALILREPNGGPVLASAWIS